MQSPLRPTVSVVIPVHDNAGTLAELQQRLAQAFSNEALQVIMVDDASSDVSLQVLRSLPVEVVPLARRVGQNGAILAGLARARGRCTCVLDADLQDPPEAMAQLVTRLRRADARVVFSSRQAQFRLSSRLFRGVARAVFPSLPKTPCLCFAIEETAREALLSVARPSDYLVAVIGGLGLRTTSVPVVRGPAPRERRGRRGLRRFGYAARMLHSIVAWRLRAGRSHQPIAGDTQERARPARPG